MTIEQNKLDAIKQAIVGGVKDKFASNKLTAQQLEGAINIASARMQDQDHTLIECHVVLPNDVINNYDAKPVEADPKATKPKHK